LEFGVRLSVSQQGDFIPKLDLFCYERRQHPFSMEQ
jgi:hypothetical protein